MDRSPIRIFYIVVICQVLLISFYFGYHESASLQQIAVLVRSLATHHSSSTPFTLRTHFTNNLESNLQQTRHLNNIYHKMYPVNCTAVFRGDESHLRQIRNTFDQEKCIFDPDHKSKLHVPSNCEVGTRWLRNCENFKRHRGYPVAPFSKEEEEFPIAYAIGVYKDSAQVERLLRSIYQPQNVYCIHVDKGSNTEYQKVIRNLSDCFDNVFVASRLLSVSWGGMGIVQADLNCMEDLLEHYIQWKYFINLAGQEFPLKTNLEIVRQLKAYNGHNCIGGKLIKKQLFRERLENRIKGPPPCPIYKGSRYIAATRGFVDFVLKSNISKTLLDWLKDSLIPDEMFIPSLHRLAEAPGGTTRKGNLGLESNMRYVRWYSDIGNLPECNGKYVRMVCIFSSKELQFLWKRPELFVDKFHYDYDPVTMQCMEELLEYRTRHPEELQNEIEYFPIRNYSWQTDK